MSSMFRIIIITILSFNTLYSQILTNDYSFLFPENNLEIKYHDEWGAKNYKYVINNFKKNPLKFNNGNLSKLGHWIYKFGNLCFIAQKEIGISSWIEKYELVNRGWTIRINDEINYYFGKPKN